MWRQIYRLTMPENPYTRRVADSQRQGPLAGQDLLCSRCQTLRENDLVFTIPDFEPGLLVKQETHLRRCRHGGGRDIGLCCNWRRRGGAAGASAWGFMICCGVA